MTQLMVRGTPVRRASMLVAALLSVGLIAYQAPAQPADLASVSITLERTACYGTCPVYTVTIHGNGSIEYFGRLNVDIPGAQKATVQPDRLKDLLKALNAIHFYDLNDSYFELCTDQPTAIISILVDGKAKRVSNYFGGCSGEKTGVQVDLSKLAEQIDAVAGSAHWVKCDHDCIKELMQAGFDVNGRGFNVNGQAPNGDTALLIAVQKGDLTSARLLLDSGALVNAADGLGLTPLMHAVIRGQPAMARELLAGGADVKAKDRKGFTALAMTADPELRRLLLAAAQKARPINKGELAQWIKKNVGCDDELPLSFYRLDYFDFKGDGNQEAIVVTSTCMAGTAGPDIHSVFSRDSSGQMVEMKIAEVDPKTFDGLLGNRNWGLFVDQGLLVASFGDDSDRDTPLIIKYKWNGTEFAVATIKKTGLYPTSYDCAKATKEVDRAICHVEALARLDLELSGLYRSLFAKLTGSERDALRDDQRRWLAARDKQCVIYKAWVSCLAKCYQRRIDELKQRCGFSPTTPAR